MHLDIVFAPWTMQHGYLVGISCALSFSFGYLVFNFEWFDVDTQFDIFIIPIGFVLTVSWCVEHFRKVPSCGLVGAGNPRSLQQQARQDAIARARGEAEMLVPQVRLTLRWNQH